MRWTCRLAVAVLGVLALTACVQTAGTPSSPPADPEALLGQSTDAVAAELGAPEIRRREPPVEVWQYRSDACVFDVYFDSPDGRTTPVVVYYEARSRNAGPTDPPGCLGEIVAGGPGRTVS